MSRPNFALDEEEDTEPVMMDQFGSSEQNRDLETDTGDDVLVYQQNTNTRRPGWLKAVIIVGLCLAAIIAIVITVRAVVVRFEQGDDKYREIMFKSIAASSIRTALLELTQVPHIAGSKEDYDTAIYVKKVFEEAGIATTIEEFPVLLNYPLQRLVEMTAPTYYKAVLEEDVVPQDPTSSNRMIPTFNGYSPSGEATAELIYANFGRQEDFEYLDTHGISVADKIVMVRYHRGFRANKCRQAEERGAVACLVYSDPKDDGFLKGPVFPEGPWRPESGVQRGTMWVGEGDPTTPGWPSTIDGPRLSINDTYNPEIMEEWVMPSIPIQPLSWHDAEPLLRALSGAQVPNADWQGGLNFTYHMGPGPAVVHVKVVMNNTVTSIWNVVGTITGSVEPDRLVLVGNHRDAWVFGAVDPSSGTAALLEMAKAFGKMISEGWKPRRTIKLLSWDAEEYGLVGSSEYAEQHAAVLTTQAVAYLNVDIAVQGSPLLAVRSSPTMTQVLKKVCKLVSSPSATTFKDQSLPTVYDMWRAADNFPTDRDPKPKPLGSGSDFTPFFQHLGITATDLGIEGENDGYDGVYHSNYDSFYWMEHFGDPTFEYHASLTRVWGLLTRELADSDIIPFNYTDYAVELKEQVQVAKRSVSGRPGYPVATNWQLLERSAQRFYDTAVAVMTEIEAYSPSDSTILKTRAYNDRLMLTERAFLDPKGLPTRSWLRHLIYAPGLFDSYSGTGFPSIIDSAFQDQLAGRI